jgi:hypothetical protein
VIGSSTPLDDLRDPLERMQAKYPAVDFGWPRGTIDRHFVLACRSSFWS